MVLKWTRTKPEPLKYFELELNLNPNRYLKRFDTLLKKFLFWKFLMTSLRVIYGLGLPNNQNSGHAYKLKIA